MGKLSIFEMVMICIKWFVRQIDRLNEDQTNCKRTLKLCREVSDVFEQENAEYKRMIYAIEQEIDNLQYDGRKGTSYATWLEIRKIINKD